MQIAAILSKKVYFFILLNESLNMEIQLYISSETKKIGYSLLSELNIQNGSGLSHYLNVNSCYNNHQAFLVWLEYLNKNNNFQLTESEIKNKLGRCIPESMINF